MPQVWYSTEFAPSSAVSCFPFSFKQLSFQPLWILRPTFEHLAFKECSLGVGPANAPNLSSLSSKLLQYSNLKVSKTKLQTTYGQSLSRVNLPASISGYPLILQV